MHLRAVQPNYEQVLHRAPVGHEHSSAAGFWVGRASSAKARASAHRVDGDQSSAVTKPKWRSAEVNASRSPLRFSGSPKDGNASPSNSIAPEDSSTSTARPQPPQFSRIVDAYHAKA